MGLFSDANDLGTAVQRKRELQRIQQQLKDEAKEEAKKELDQHEEDKKQGMI